MPHLGGALYGFVPSFTCNDNVPLKYSILEKHQQIPCVLTVILVLAFMSASLPGPARK